MTSPSRARSAEPVLLDQSSSGVARGGVWADAAAGFVGGLAGSFVMNRFQEAWTALAVNPSRNRFHLEQGGQIKKSARHLPWSIEKSEAATAKAVGALSRAMRGRRLDRRSRRRAGAALHYLFGGICGAIYGAAAGRSPSVTAGRGIPFGLAVWLGADEISMPATGLAKPPFAYPLSAHLRSLAAHAVYGATTEVVRRIVSRFLGRDRDLVRGWILGESPGATSPLMSTVREADR